MTREIKFRLPIFDKDGKFQYWHYWGFIRENSDFYFAGIPVAPKIAQKLSQQFTGLKGKQDVEIYERDILGGLWRGGWVCWCETCKSFEYIDKVFGCMACSGDVSWAEIVEDESNLEVIGNISLNPELLEEK